MYVYVYIYIYISVVLCGYNIYILYYIYIYIYVIYIYIYIYLILYIYTYIYIYMAELLFEAFMKASESRQRGVCVTLQGWNWATKARRVCGLWDGRQTYNRSDIGKSIQTGPGKAWAGWLDGSISTALCESLLKRGLPQFRPTKHNKIKVVYR